MLGGKEIRGCYDWDDGGDRFGVREVSGDYGGVAVWKGVDGVSGGCVGVVALQRTVVST